jgi:hypothetical protein
VRSAIFFDCLLAYPIVSLISIVFIEINFIFGLIVSAAMLIGSSYLSVKMFYRIHTVDPKG